MECPYCGNDMVSGLIQSGRHVFFTDRDRYDFFIMLPTSGEDVLLTKHNWTRPHRKAYKCKHCHKVIVDYAPEDDPA